MTNYIKASTLKERVTAKDNERLASLKNRLAREKDALAKAREDSSRDKKDPTHKMAIEMHQGNIARLKQQIESAK